MTEASPFVFAAVNFSDCIREAAGRFVLELDFAGQLPRSDGENYDLESVAEWFGNQP